MGFEDAIPPVPTRVQELKYINKVEKGFLQQPWYKLYMNEALRTKKLDDTYYKNNLKVEKLRNFLIGGVIFGTILYKPVIWTYQSNYGIPHIYRPKTVPFEDGYLKNRNRLIGTTWLGLTIVLAYAYAAHNVTAWYDDEYITNKSVLVEPFD